MPRHTLTTAPPTRFNCEFPLIISGNKSSRTSIIVDAKAGFDGCLDITQTRVLELRSPRGQRSIPSYGSEPNGGITMAGDVNRRGFLGTLGGGAGAPRAPPARAGPPAAAGAPA